MYALVYSDGDMCGWFEFSVVAVSEDIEKLKIKREEEIKRDVKRSESDWTSANSQTKENYLKRIKGSLEKQYEIREDIEVL